MPKKGYKMTIEHKNKIPTEYEEACVLAEWLTLKGIKFSHIAQETFTRNWGTKMKNKRMGVNSGVPDYICIVNNHLIWIELKRQKGGAVSPAQQSWIDALNACKNCGAFVTKGADEAIAIINKYL